MGSAKMNKGIEKGVMNPDGSLIYNMFKHKNGRGKIETFHLENVKIIDSSMHCKTMMVEGQPKVSIVLTMGVKILEKEIKVTNKQVVNNFGKEIESQFRKVLIQSQKENTDVFGLGQLFRNNFLT